MEKLKVFKMKLSVPLPDNHEELHSEQIRCKVRAVWYTYTLEHISHFAPFVLLRLSLLLTHIITQTMCHIHQLPLAWLSG